MRAPLACAVLLLAACGQPDGASEAAWTARQAAVDPLQLWSVAVQEQARTGKPVLICTDQKIRSGLHKPDPAVAGAPCARIGDPIVSERAFSYRCAMGGQAWRIGSTWTGDVERDYTATFTFDPLDLDQPRYRQVRRFVRLGDCPQGWKLGDTTDQQGRIRSALAVE